MLLHTSLSRPAPPNFYFRILNSPLIRITHKKTKALSTFFQSVVIILKKPFDEVPIWHIQSQSQFSNIEWDIRQWVNWYTHYSMTMAANSILIAYLETFWQSTYMTYTKPKPISQYLMWYKTVNKLIYSLLSDYGC